jgi:hypothetical protein
MAIREARSKLMAKLLDTKMTAAVKLESEYVEKRKQGFLWMIGQTEATAKSFLEGDPKWSKINESRDPLKLAKLIS